MRLTERDFENGTPVELKKFQWLTRVSVMICGCGFARGKGDPKARRDHQLRSEWKGCGVSENDAALYSDGEDSTRAPLTTASSLNSGHMLEEACFEFAGIDPSCDEHNPRSMIGIRPSIEQHRGVKNVVDAVNCHWGALADQVYDALDAQQIVTCAAPQPAKP
jgi:hypothetical protein